MKRLRTFLLLMILLVLGNGVFAESSKKVSVKRILIIDSFSSLDTWTNELKQGLKSYLNRDDQLLTTFETYELAVRFKPNFQPAPEDIAALKIKLKNSGYDMIVLTNNAAVDLFLSGRLAVPERIPLLVASYHGPLQARIPKGMNMTGVETPNTLYRNVKLGSQLLPDNRRVTVIAEASVDVSAIQKIFNRQRQEAWARDLDIHFISGRDYTTQEMLNCIAALPSTSLLVFHSWNSLQDKEPQDYFSILPRIREKFQGLIINRYREMISRGASGGIMVSGNEQGRQAGSLAQRIFNGEPAASIPVLQGTFHSVFDYPSLQRAGIDPKRLPPGTELANPPVDFITRYQVEIISVLAAIGLLLLLLLFRQVTLGRMKKRIAVLFHNLPLRICVVNRSGQILFQHLPHEMPYQEWNGAYNIKQLTGKMQQEFSIWVQEVFQTGRRMEKDYELDGKYRHVEFIPLSGNNSFHEEVVMWISSDQTELHHAHREVSRIAEQFRLTLESIGDGVIATDKEERITLLNPVAIHMTGYDIEEARGKRLNEIFNIISYIDGKQVESPLTKALSTGKIVELANHTDLIARNGTSRHIADSAAPIRDMEGKIIGGVLVFRDVTDEYNKRDRLRANSVILANAAKIAKFFYFQCDSDGRLTALSEQNYRPFREGCRMLLTEWLAPDNQEDFDRNWKRFLLDGIADAARCFSEVFASGERYFELRAEKSVNEINGKWEICGVVQDITELSEQQKKLQQALEQAQAADRAKSYFLATVSHELRTPLNAVIGFSELLQGTDIDPQERQEYLNSINCAGNALLDLVNDVLDLSRLEADQMELDYQPVDLKRLIREIVGVFRLKAVEKNLSLQVTYADLPSIVYLDNLRIRQVLLNLTGNALKFTHRGGVSVSVIFHFAGEAKCGTLTFDITDTGIGISPEKISQIFEPFVQDSGTRGTRVYEGSGLGLAISKRLVEKMGGKLSVVSSPGKGSTFTVKLENVKYQFLTPGEAATLGLETECLNSPSSQGIHALLVDDVPMNLKVLQAMLKKLDVNCVLAESAEKALEILQQGWQFDIILTDLWMPGLSGSAFADLLKRNEQTAGIPVVAVTADTQITSEDAQKFRQVLTKPITRQALIDAFRANGLNI